ncbi:cadherin-related family member 5 isoform X2 [Alexandromys fortis]|uniref:cadherin-related family member 5 isoform X2 n=1 Tax=Alexandromys fortis TaxID=100897 RepID=UPI002152D9AA|nr:cadherin-related family member 5 isoform X2 [Microtus fortis]
MGAPALLWPPLLLPWLLVLLGQPLGTSAQDQVCSVDQQVVQIKENSSISEPLLNISVSDGLHVALGSGSTPSTFEIVDNKLFLIVTPDYEENSFLEAVLECKRGNTVVTELFVYVIILDINDNPPKFPFTTKEYNVSEDTRVGTIVIPGTELAAKDVDVDDTLYYTLQEVTPNASSFFSLAGLTNPALTLSRTLDFYKNQDMTFRLLAQDTWDAESTEPSHTATATLIINVLPADLRTPWFLPCSFSDGYFCIHAQYRGVVPTGLLLSSPLILSPGPIYAVDGDQAINQPIIYSIRRGNTNDTFIIDEKSGNLTMSKSIPSPMTFTLLVRADQDDMASYSMTQAVVEARDVPENSLQFSQSLYHGTVVLGSEADTAVKDRTSPSETLRIQAQYSDFLDLNSDITYRITNSSDFRMDTDVMLTNKTMKETDVFYVQVEATSTVTNDTATTVVEIQVSEQEAPSTGTSTTSQPVTPSGGSTETPKPGTSQPTAPTSRTSTSLIPSTSRGDSTQTPKPGASQPVIPITGTSTSSQPATPGVGSTQTPKPGASQPTATTSSRSPSSSGEGAMGDHKFSTVDMAVLGGVLGALLLLALIGLVILIHKHYRHRFNCCCKGKAKVPPPQNNYDNLTFLPDHKTSWSSTSNPQPQPDPEPSQPPSGSHSPMSSSPTPPSSAPPSPELRASGSPKTVQAGDSPSAVKSILTKERRPEGDGGYKAVWFGKDIREDADVVVLNEPTADMDSASATESEGSDDDEPDQKKGLHLGADIDHTYI